MPATEAATAFRMAVDNIAAWGDTDVFPLPPENHVLFDRPDDVVALLTQLDSNFKRWQDDYNPFNESVLAMVGYTAFRWVTQLDPLWNAYLLGLVLRLADDIENARIPREQQIVFSYRFEYDPATHRLFAESAWRDFNIRSLDLASASSHVLICDIADFYARIYHHRVENSLLFLDAGPDVPKRIDTVLSMFTSGGVSYGLPVGGPAARILSEILLNRIDRLLQTAGITFCRFADDYRIFTPSREKAYDALRFLTEKLLEHEGLTLQRAKTRILTAKDFTTSSAFAVPDADADRTPGSSTARAQQPSEVAPIPKGDRPQVEDPPIPVDGVDPEPVVPEPGDAGLQTSPSEDALGDTEMPEDNLDSGGTASIAPQPQSDRAMEKAERSFLSLSLRYDPYSPTAQEDYAALKEQVERFDIIGLLARELAKTRIHAALTRRLLQALRYLDPASRDGAARSLVDNIETLAPVFPNVMRALANGFDDFGATTQAYVGDEVKSMIAERPYYVAVPINLGYAVRLLARMKNEDNQLLLAQIYPDAPHFVQRDIVLIMGRWRATSKFGSAGS